MGSAVLTALAVGGLGGCWVGYRLGQTRAAIRGAASSYRAVRRPRG